MDGLLKAIVNRSTSMQQMTWRGVLRARKEVVRRVKQARSRSRLWWRRQLDEPTIILSSAILAVGILFVIVLYAAIPAWREDFFPGVFVEFNGMLFDVVLFGIIVATFVRRMERRQERQRQQEILDDYKKWDTEKEDFA
ncbi:hypothetical protein BMJ20_33515 [Sinorhizobium medicae]|uniref:hypothetical protein n=1 Tax=Sinorhizobium medicae TaxID=110321 RepID=UPI000C7A531B|nr:hypothetical protein [Sinorhizobium medicae]PLU25403.1 hypothetical protein BMJ31_10085 [Sinorhizobium medicae]PLU35237.1 hypothetical protein BMJ28_16880 [Sinorhizobium medicae]PLU65099.1 hypothetical protein BMJ20_33515 [Sinorhizobium medicae]